MLNLAVPRLNIPPRYLGVPARYPLFSALCVLMTIWFIAFIDTGNHITRVYSNTRGAVSRDAQALRDLVDSNNAEMDLRERIIGQKQNVLFVLEQDLIQREKALIPAMTKYSGKAKALKQKSLVVYAYFETASARRNLQFFIQHGLWDDGLTDFIFIFNGETDAESLLPNNPHSKYWDPRFLNGGGPKITSIKRDNTCYDLGAHSEVLLQEVELDDDEEGVPGNWDMAEKVAAIEKEYAEKERLEMEEAARKGRIEAERLERLKETGKTPKDIDHIAESKAEAKHKRELSATDKAINNLKAEMAAKKKRSGELWEKYSRFILMNASIRGPFIPSWSNTCWPEAFWDKLTEKVKMVGMAYNCHEGQGHVQSMVWAVDRVGLAAILQRRPDGIGHWCPESMIDAITGEIHGTLAIRNAGYEVDVLTAVWHSKDVLDLDGDGRGDGTKGYWHDCKDSDFFHEGAYYGFNVHPYETVFMKTARQMEEELIGNLTEWHDGSGYSSYQACKPLV